MTTADMVRAGIYCRISQDRHGRGLGVERQRRECLALADSLGWSVHDFYVDNDVSAYSGRRRDGFERLLVDIADRRVTGLIAWDSDRLTRSPIDLERLIVLLRRRGVVLHSVTAGRIDLTTAAGRMFARAMGAVAVYESDHKSERAKSKSHELALTGAPTTGGIYRPYGYLPDRVTVDPVEAAVVRELVRRYLRGESTPQLAKALNARDLTTSSGNPWRPETVLRLITSTRIAGWRGTPMPRSIAPHYWGEFLAKAQWPAIVSRTDVERVRALVSDDTLRPGSRNQWLLNELLVCGRCGFTMRSELTPKTRDKRRYWCLHGSPGRCGRMTIVAHVEDHVTDLVHAEVKAGLIARILDSDPILLEAPNLLVDDAHVQLTLLTDDRDDGLITRQEWLLRSNRLRRRIETLKAAAPPLTQQELAQVPTATFGRYWEAATMKRKRDLVRTLTARIAIMPGRRGGNPHRYQYDRVHITWRA